MSLKAKLEIWTAALKAHDEEDFDKALKLFSRIADSSKILWNMGLIHATVEEHESAVEHFIEASNLGQYLPIVYFQSGVSNFLLTRYEFAFRDFEQALFHMKGISEINFERFGLRFRLFTAEILYNKGLSLIYMGRVQEGLEDMQSASRKKAIEEHNVIDEAIQECGENYTVFSVPVGVLYRPTEKQLRNAATRNSPRKPSTEDEEEDEEDEEEDWTVGEEGAYSDTERASDWATERTNDRMDRMAVSPIHSPQQTFAEKQAAIAEAYQRCNSLLLALLSPGTLGGKKFLERNLEKEDSQCLIDYLTKVFDDELIVEKDKARRLLSLLFRLSKSNQVFPAARKLKGVRCNLRRPLFEGGFGYVYRGSYQGQAVAVKAARLTQFQDNSHNLKAQAREFALWAHLSHRNIVPFYGVYLSEETLPRICIVSPWMENGNLNRYLVTSPDVLRIPLLLDVINGLQYLHQLKIIHTDLKGGNILISSAGRAMITDFGISSIAITLQTVTTGPTGTPYWIAPEVVTGTTRPTLESDIWSYGCVCYEVFTGKTPFYQYAKPHLLIVAFLKGHITPTRPTAREAHEQLTDETWELMMECWNHDPQKRPTPEEIISFFQILDIPDGRPPAEDEQIITANVRAARSKTVIDYDRTYGILNRLSEARRSNPEDEDDDGLEYA